MPHPASSDSQCGIIEPIVWVLIVMLICILILIMICDFNESFKTERLETSRYADCPTGYILNGSNCIPDGSGPMKQTCEGTDTALNNGICERSQAAECPRGYDNYVTNCRDTSTGKILPISQAVCPDDMEKNRAMCVKRYLGSCLPYFKNTEIGVNACVPEMPVIYPQCNSDEVFKDGRCIKSSTEAFKRANQIEEEALRSLSM